MKAASFAGQTEAFLASEGDSWYQRNRLAIENATPSYDESVLCQALRPFAGELNRILEIGCSSGIKLERLCDHFDARGWGIDPSAKAVEAGNHRFATTNRKNLELQVGTADALPFGKGTFDLVYFAFCLVYIDRDRLLGAIAEADRVLRPGGFLAILDFDPSQRQMRAYHHLEGVFCYKHHYADLFTATGHYYLVCKQSFSHSANHFAKDSDERVSVSVLYKEPSAYWLHRTA